MVIAQYVVGILIGGTVGALMGARGTCETGTCPLTSNPYIGGLYGAAMGFFVVSILMGSTAPKASTETKTMVTSSTVSISEIKTAGEFKEQVLNAPVPVLVDLWATWCGPCRAQIPIIEKVAEQAGEKARVVKINVDQAPELAESLKVSAIPTLLVFKSGKEEQRMVGVQSAETLARALGL